MGRTIAPFTQLVLQEIDSWAKFRRALRKEDQDALDELLTAAKFHAATSAYASRVVPFETMLVSMLIEQQKQIRELREGLEDTSGEKGAIERSSSSRPQAEECRQ